MLRSGQAVLRNVQADLVSLGSGVFALRQGAVDLIANAFANSRTFFKALIVSACVQG
jgi:hypothetical protein